jgi:tRNA A37 methylthiotransferase MiaB
MRVFIDGTGCVLRKLDESRLRNYFILNNSEIADNPDSADYALYVTCGVLNSMVVACMNKIKEYSSSGTPMIVAGCMPVMTPEIIKAACTPYAMVPTNNLEKIDELFPEFKVKFNDVPLSFSTGSKGSDYIKARHNYSARRIVSYSVGKEFLKKVRFYTYRKRISRRRTGFMVTSRGCNRHCTYCGVKDAVGKLRSLPLNDVVENYRDVLSKGIEHIYFMSDDTTAYGEDIGDSFSNLMNTLDAITPQGITWGLENFHPSGVIRHFDVILQMVKKKRLVSIEVPTQHFSPRMLKKMNRHYDIDKALPLMAELKKAFPQLYVSTHYIFGFPGETEQDISIANSYAEKASFDYYMLNLYFENGNTPSVMFSDKVPVDVAHQRMRDFSRLLSRMGVLHSLFPNQIINEEMDRRFIIQDR